MTAFDIREDKNCDRSDNECFLIRRRKPFEKSNFTVFKDLHLISILSNLSGLKNLSSLEP